MPSDGKTVAVFALLAVGCAEPLPGPGPAGEERQITTDTAGQYDPAIDGDRIVWADKRNGNADIYLYWRH